MKEDIFLVALLCLITVYLLYRINPSILSRNVSAHSEMVEPFVATQTLDSKQLYDTFYSSVYDQLFYSRPKTLFEVHDLEKNTIPSRKGVRILDIGCGTGHHLKQLSGAKRYECVGLDQSKSMLRKARKNAPKAKLIYGNFLNPDLFPPLSFSHITCYFFTVYYTPNKAKLFTNVWKWLKYGGYFVLHLVKKDSFDPLLERANPFIAVSLQKYSKKRLTRSQIKFNDMDYTSDLTRKSPNKFLFQETFLFKNRPRLRKQVHTFTMEKIKDIIRVLKRVGFSQVGFTNLMSIGYEHQYILYFRKDRTPHNEGAQVPL